MDDHTSNSFHFPPGKENALRVPPSNLQLEQAVLGALLANSARVYPMVAETLRAEHFYDPVNGGIYREIVKLCEAGETADAITLRSRFAHTGILDEVGGTAYLAQLITAMVGLTLAKDYAAEVTHLWRCRKIIEATEEISEFAWSARRETSDFAAEVSAKIERMFEEDTAERGPVTLDDSIDAAMAAMDRAASRGGAGGVTTGMGRVDRAIRGMHPGKLVILAGRPGMGKSSLGMQWALAAARQAKAMTEADGIRRGVFVGSMEMGNEPLAARVLSVCSGISLRKIQSGRVDQTEAAAILAARNALRGLPLIIDDRAAPTAAKLISRIRSAARRLGRLHLVALDHMHIVRPESADVKGGGLAFAVGQISGALKRAAKQFDCPVLALAQLSRGVEGRDDKRPTLGDLRNSGDIEQDADAVAFVYRAHYYLAREVLEQRDKEAAETYANRVTKHDERVAEAKDKAELIFAKVREGEPHTVHLTWTGSTTSFAEPERKHGENHGND